ncbi:MAG TPA: alpha/beta fold hydrolase [Thermoanaerobaculia bacterium]
MHRILIALALALPAPAAAQTIDDFAGAYEAALGEHIAVSVMDAGGSRLLLMADTRDDALRVLFPVAGDTFMTGTTIADPSTRERRVVFTRRGGIVDRVELTPVDGGSVRSARRIDLELTPITMARGGVRLDGTLYLPPQPRGRVPLIALAHGSENNDRRSFGPLPWVFAANGYAVLTYDKRGTGTSTGSWSDAGIEELAADLAAAIAHVSERRDIDATRIAIVGSSEGGWVAPAAARTVPVRTIVALSGGGLTKGHAYVHKNRMLALEQGLAGAALDSAIAEAQLTIDESAARVRANANPSGFDRRVTYDPAADWSAFRGPVLYMGGEIDVLENAAESAAWLRRVFADAGNPDFVARVFPRAHHSMLLGREGTPTEFRTLAGIAQLAPGYWPVLLRWLDSTLR